MIHFFAILGTDDIVLRRIPLDQRVEHDVKTLFSSHLVEYFDPDVSIEPFQVGYTLDEDSAFFVDLALSEVFSNIPDNTNVYRALNRENEIPLIKVIFTYDEATQIYYFQNFDKRNLLSRKKVAIWSDENTFTTLQDSNAFIIENVVHALYKDGKLYFKNFLQANKIFDLSDFFSEASKHDIEDVFSSVIFNTDIEWLKANSDSVMKKQITVLKKSGMLNKVKPKSRNFIAAAKRVGIPEDVYHSGLIVLPKEKKQCKQVLAFLNQDIFPGLLTPKQLFRTNSKKKMN